MTGKPSPIRYVGPPDLAAGAAHAEAAGRDDCGRSPDRQAAAVIDLPVPDDAHAEELSATLRSVDNEPFLQAVSGRPVRLHHRSVDTLVAAPDAGGFGSAAEPTWSLLLRAVHLSFAAHLPLSLSPDVLWFAVVHEVAAHVRLNADHYAGVFTDTPGHRPPILVRDDSLLDPDPDWSRSIRLVLDPLRERIGPEVTDLFLPGFSTTTPDDVSSALVALMSVVSPYYRFEWLSLCGIPRIRLDGTAEDWALLSTRVRELAPWFDGLGAWFDALRPVLDEIAATAAGGPVDEDFWRSLYKWESRSGGDFVSGWITVLFAHTQTPAGPRPKESFRWRGGERYLENAFPSHVATVPFRWTRPDGPREMQFLAGVLGIERDDDGYLRPRLAHAVTELLPSSPHPSDHLLPDGWTHSRLREASGCATARALTLDLTVLVPTQDGWPAEVEATHAVQVAMYCYVRAAADGVWYVGDLLEESDEVVLWDRLGTDLAEALLRI
ncbi:DUF4419 domain-containing protein [Streptacidiphilus jiangxiensis]|uniref:DUF4419 domain-containing protein n=1 Tax=Streptacidiphilus jiangxiensis TaxID=235985 RepID=A0A1H7ZN74_STRJI|nr:DUF4419 domain-containing protein [Streptacidiphilus jiangxiensis]SEM58939.1 protein of unknown function [Streptacidiphilus jiangxiensis]